MALRLPGIAAVALLVVGGSAASASDDAAVGPEDAIGAVFAFNRICYAQVPALQGIRNMATQLGWKPLSAAQLEPFGDRDALSSLEGWDVQLGVEFYRLGLAQGPVSAATAAQFPEFAAGVSTSCSLVLGDEQDPAVVAADMQQLAGKPPVSTDVDEGSVLTTTWAGGNDDFKVFLFNKASKSGEGSVLNVTLISRE